MRRAQPPVWPTIPYRPERGQVGITYLPRRGSSWLYLAGWLGRCSRKAVGWYVRDPMPENLVSEALRFALPWLCPPPSGLVVASNQDSPHSSARFKQLLTCDGARQSMSRPGTCYNNAHAEFFWSRFKTELLDGVRFPGLVEAKPATSHHIADYNAERRHSALGSRAPNHFETHLQTTSQRCPA